MKELGVFGLVVPAPYGEVQVSTACFALVTEELARGWMSLAGCDGRAQRRLLAASRRTAPTRSASGTSPGWRPASSGPRWRSPSPAAVRTCRPCARPLGCRRRRLGRRRREDLDQQRPARRADRAAVQDRSARRPAAPGHEHPAGREGARAHRRAGPAQARLQGRRELRGRPRRLPGAAGRRPRRGARARASAR